MKYAIIGDEETVLSFGMVGVSGKTAASPDEAETAFQEMLEDRNVGIIIVTENVADMMRATVDKYLFTVSFPLIVEIPDRKGAKPGRRGFKELVNGAIGIKL
jgi:V/A-type H+/Na+-transporting ATPase subunit F